MKDYEQLGAFFLGRRYDMNSKTISSENILYDAKDLTTHAVCVGMTGSGKTGLCLSLLEEAALDNIPVIAIDPKGDLGNLCLTFPKLRPKDFEPWVDSGQAMRQGQSVPDFAADVARTWKEGLKEWGQTGERIGRLRSAADVSIYTPGSVAGLPLSLLTSFAAPGEQLRADSDALRDKVAGAASGLLTLLGVDADPISSREHILLANLFATAWEAGDTVELTDLIRSVQDPPFERVGILDLESFFPKKDRVQLSLRINNLLASPSFSGWLEGEPLDAQRLLYTAEGKPRVSIISIAHLNDAERMFFVTMVLNEVLGWMRCQAGTNSLRAILYMDEVFGYFPPTANPPSKKPMLTLLKQARAFGLGVVLATQNPVDLDYKGLSNTGTWFLGRLQTERDKIRVLDGLEGVTGGSGHAFDRASMERTLAGLGSRVFLMHNVHEDEPVVFSTRWAMSYLRGPLTRQQIKELMKSRRESQSDQVPSPDVVDLTELPAHDSSEIGTVAADGANGANGEVREREPAESTFIVPADIEQRYRPISSTSVERRRLVYRPQLIGLADLHYKRATYDVDIWPSIGILVTSPDENSPWRDGTKMIAAESSLLSSAEPQSEFEAPSAALLNARHYRDWSRKFKQHLYQHERLNLLQCKELKAISKPDESEGDFRARLSQMANEKRDLDVEKLRSKFATKLKTVRDRLDRANQRLESEREQFQSKSIDSFLSVGQTLLGAVLGRKLASKTNVNSATSSARRLKGAATERGDISRAKQDVKKYEAQLGDLEKSFREQADQIRQKLDASRIVLKEIVIPPTKSDINVRLVGLLWNPWWVDEAGNAVPAWVIT